MNKKIVVLPHQIPPIIDKSVLNVLNLKIKANDKKKIGSTPSTLLELFKSTMKSVVN